MYTRTKAVREGRRTRAEAVQAARALLTDAQQLDRLDKLFGKGVGAKRERSRIAARIKAKP